MPAACVLCFSACLTVVYRSYQVITFLRGEEIMERERKNNGDPNQVDGERNRRASIFLLINPLKINTTRFDSFRNALGIG